MSIEIKWNRSPQQILDRIFDRETMIQIHTQLKLFCADYVPATEAEALTNSAIPTPDYLLYPGPYAHYQWEGILFLDERGSSWAKKDHDKYPTSKKLKYGKEPHSLATSHWEKAMMVGKGDQFCKNIEYYLKKK